MKFRKTTLLILLMALMMPLGASAQRIQQSLGRGVVATLDPSTSSSLLVSWRKLAQEPEDCSYNIYIRKSGATEFTKLNDDPIEKTCYATSLSSIPYNTEIAVTLVDGDTESDLSNPFTLVEHDWKDVFLDIDFETDVLYPNSYQCKFAWPMDLDGDGEIDALLCDRNYSSSNYDGTDDPNCTTTSDKLQAYTLDGECLWTIDMGMNVDISSGQNDMVTVYDINCDGICEVIIRSSDGTRFWDKDNNDWGEYILGTEDGDTDGDGIVNYRSSSSMNPPYFVTIVDGNTGAEIVSAELDYDAITDGTDQYSRTNRSEYYTDSEGTEYAFLQSKFAICYFDGIHPSLAVQCYDRSTSSGHHYYVCEWKYDWTDGVPSNWHHAYTWCMSGTDAAEFHQVRVCDVDGDGIDELMEGGYAVNSTKGLVMCPAIGHGDRFDVSDIDPDRPGLEVYAIQQSNLLGQVLYDAETGEHIKEWYLSSIGDVGRGRCIDVDASVKGYEVFSTMQNLYDCKGNVITEGDTTYPVEAIWWNDDLQRELISSPGGSGSSTNVMVMTYSGSRLIQFSSESSWAVHAASAVRPAFMGDMIGDWREEIILFKQGSSTSTGLIGYATNIETDYSMYCLQEDPHYRLDCTGRGYYQMPCTGFYLGGDMPYPPLPPVMVTDLRWADGSTWTSGGSGFTSFDQSTSQSYSDGQSVIFDMSATSQDVSISGSLAPSTVYIMNPKGVDYTFSGSGTLTGDMDLWKSMQGTATIDNDLSYTGTTIISEGTLCLNGNVSGPIEIRAKGTLSGTGTYSGDIAFEGALNYEGCRLMPGNDDETCGTMTFGKSLTIPGVVYIEAAIDDTLSSKIYVQGDLTLDGSNTITIDLGDTFSYDYEYVVAQCSGTLTAVEDSISVSGLDGFNYSLLISDNQIAIMINSTRDAESGVEWTGEESDVWNYKTYNFDLNGESTTFVPGDEVIFTDDSDVREITVNETMTPGSVTFDFDEDSYTFSGDGAIGGEGGITKNGEGEVIMNLTSNSYTGATVINAGTLTVTNLADGDKVSSLGSAPADEGYIELNGGTLKVDASSMATNRIINVNDTATINIASSSGTVSLTGIVQGDGYLIKDGPGQLNFTYGGENPFAGLILKNGTVAQGAWNSTFGKDGSRMVLAGGTVQLLDVNNSSTRPIFNYLTTVEDGTENTIVGTTRGAVNGTFYGTGTVTIKSTGVRSDVGCTFTAFEGTLICYGENFRLQSNVTDMRGTDVIMDSGSCVSHYASNSSTKQTTTTRMGSLSSSASDCYLGHGSDTYLVGYNDKSTTFKGVLQAKSIKKYGEGTWTLTSSESTSPVTVVEGTLQLYNNPLYSTPTAFSSGLLTIQSGATLCGTGGASDITVESGGVITAGYNGGYGTLKATGDVTLEEGSTMKIKVGAYSNGTAINDKFKFNGTLTHSNDTLLIVVDESRTLEAGDEITIFTGSGEQTGTYILVTESADEIYWDDSQLLSDGILTVYDVVSGIKKVTGDDETVDVYTLDGIMVRSNVPYNSALDGLSNGVYLVNGQKMVKK